jgi:hypothetical protein
VEHRDDDTGGAKDDECLLVEGGVERGVSIRRISARLADLQFISARLISPYDRRHDGVSLDEVEWIVI